MPSNKPVLVTGASGFIAIHCIIQLLEQGYQVRGTLRSANRESELRSTLAKFVKADERLTFVHANLLEDAGWAEAVRGCDYVLHVASPFPFEAPKDENDLIRPAKEGTLRVLRAAADNGVKRVVLTSSVAAISAGHPREKTHFDEKDWSLADSPTIESYPKSKTLAESAAWEFIQNLPQGQSLELAVINPGYVLGPLPDTHQRTSGELLQQLMSGKLPGLARIQFSGVDVRDVAVAHIAAMTTPEAAGKRFLCVAQQFWLKDAAEILNKHFTKRGYKISMTVMPSWLVRIVAIFLPQIRPTLPSLDREVYIDSSLTRKVLNWKPRALEETFVDMAESMIELKLV
jgi:nucleoside-diphosphate-sugar epimerase